MAVAIGGKKKENVFFPGYPNGEGEILHCRVTYLAKEKKLNVSNIASAGEKEWYS